MLKSFLFIQSSIRSLILKFKFLNLYFDKRESFAAHAAAEHLLLSVATKVSKSAFYLPKQQPVISAKFSFLLNVRQRQFESVIYHQQSRNALFYRKPSLLPSACKCRRSQIHVDIHGGFILSSSQCKRSATFHIFSFADVCDCRNVNLV